MGGDTVRRWTDKALVGAIGLVLTMVAFMWVTLAGQVETTRATNVAQDVRIERIDTTLKSIDVRQERMDVKIDKILDKVK